MWQINKRIFTYIGLLVVSLVLMLYLGTRGSQSAKNDQIALPRDYRQIRLEGKLRLLAPYNGLDYKTDDKGQTTGAVYDWAKRISDRTECQVLVILENDPSKALEMLRRGEVDLIAYPVLRTGLTDTADFSLIEEQVSKPLYLVQRSDSMRLTSQSQLAGKTIRLGKGSDYGLFLEHLSEDIGDSIYVEYDPLYATEQLVMQVSSGKIGYTVCNAREASAYPTKIGGIDCSLPLSYNLRQSWLLRRTSPELRDSLLVWLHNQ